MTILGSFSPKSRSITSSQETKAIQPKSLRTGFIFNFMLFEFEIVGNGGQDIEQRQFYDLRSARIFRNFPEIYAIGVLSRISIVYRKVDIGGEIIRLLQLQGGSQVQPVVIRIPVGVPFVIQVDDLSLNLIFSYGKCDCIAGIINKRSRKGPFRI